MSGLGVHLEIVVLKRAWVRSSKWQDESMFLVIVAATSGQLLVNGPHTTGGVIVEVLAIAAILLLIGGIYFYRVRQLKNLPPRD